MEIGICKCDSIIIYKLTSSHLSLIKSSGAIQFILFDPIRSLMQDVF